MPGATPANPPGPYSPLGNNDTGTALTPVAVWRSDIDLLTGAEEVVAGSHHSCARLSSGSVACWGSGFLGRLGNGDLSDSIRATFVSGLADAVGISAHLDHTCALRANGRVVCWGYGGWGQLGDGEQRETRSAPVEVLEPVRRNRCLGWLSTCALRTGGLRCLLGQG